MSSFLINTNFILICSQLLINLNSISESSGDYIDKMRIKHVTTTVFYDVTDDVVYIILLFDSQLLDKEVDVKKKCTRKQ